MAPEKILTERFKKISLGLSVLVFLISVLVLIQWKFETDFINIFLPQDTPMNPLSAIIFMLSIIAFWLKFDEKEKKYIYANIICIGIFWICSMKLLSITFHWTFTPDLLLFKNKIVEKYGYTGGQIAFNTCLSFMCASLALILIDYETSKGIRPAQYICFMIIFIALVATYGFIYKIIFLYAVFTNNPIAIHTTISLYLLALAILLARPDKGYMRLLIGEHFVQNFLLRAFAMVLPLFLGWLKLKGENNGWYSKEMGVAIFAMLTYFTGLSLIAFNTVYQQKIRSINQMVTEKLKENESRLSTLASNIDEAVIVYDKNGKNIFYNKNSVDLFGPEQNVPSEKLSEAYGLYYTNENTHIQKEDLPLFKALKGFPVDNFEIMLKNQKFPEGKILNANGRTVNDDNGNVVEGILVIRDITPRKLLETVIQERSNQFKTILNSIGEGVLVADMDGRFKFFNPKAEELIGKPLKNIDMENWTNYYGVYYPDKFTAFPANKLPLYKALKGESTNELEVYIKNEIIQEGKLLRITGRPVKDEKGNITGGVVVFREV